MFNKSFSGLFQSGAVAISVYDFLLCVGASLLAGLILALAFTFRSKYTKSFAVTLAILPAVVCVVIMMVNGNVGTGVAVAGAFSLVRFRSQPGSAMEIAALFVAMAAGLISGMGYLAYSLLFVTVMSAVSLVYTLAGFGNKTRDGLVKEFKITVPEDLDYTGVFDELFDQYAAKYELLRVKSINMGSMFRVTYLVKLKSDTSERELIDRVRERNGNLEIMVSRIEENGESL